MLIIPSTCQQAERVKQLEEEVTGVNGIPYSSTLSDTLQLVRTYRTLHIQSGLKLQ